jgi:hypothetical protein
MHAPQGLESPLRTKLIAAACEAHKAVLLGFLPSFPLQLTLASALRKISGSLRLSVPTLSGRQCELNQDFSSGKLDETVE